MTPEPRPVHFTDEQLLANYEVLATQTANPLHRAAITRRDMLRAKIAAMAEQP